jgi:hypothetical protein
VDWDVCKTSRINGEVVPANGEISMFSVKWTDQTRALTAIIENLDYNVCYCWYWKSAGTIHATTADAAASALSTGPASLQTDRPGNRESSHEYDRKAGRQNLIF